MRLGVISDIHGNRVALEAVFADMPAVDQMVCAGDVVGYNPWPAACVEMIRDRAIPTVMGNHDRAVATGTAFRFNAMAKAGVEYARDQLSESDREWLSSLPTERRVADDAVKIVHGHPADPDYYTYPREFSPELLGQGPGPTEQVLILGHTHVQHQETYEAGIVLNPGSVGQPRDGDPRAAYAVVDLDSLEAELHRVEYDIDAVAEAVERADLPARIADRLYEGR